MAAGIGGSGQALARYGSAQNIGSAQAEANQAATMLRAKELTDARSLYGQNASAMQQGAAGMSNQMGNQALGLGGIASGTGIAQFNQQQQQQGLGALFQGLGQAGSAYFGRQPDTDSSGGGGSFGGGSGDVTYV
jgi:hypothetical protein